MAGARSGAVTELLRAWRQGDARAQEKLLPLVYRELHRQAAAYLRRERRNHSLVATALIHETYIRLVGQDADYHNRAHFFGIAAQMMRRVLVDHARARAAQKRPRPELQVSLEDALPVAQPAELDVQGLDRALDELAKFDARQARLVELRYFGGLTIEATAEVMGVSPMTVKREWKMARAWLHSYLTRSSASDDA